jgi:23S rRNA (uracil1939-C5)-methyltransferase
LSGNDPILTVRTELPVYGGYALARLPEGRREQVQRHQGGKVIFVRGAIPGETVEVEIDEERRDFSRATVTRVIEASPFRVTPPCPYFGICGGCQFQHIEYREQVVMKEQVLRDCLARIAGIHAELLPSLTGTPWHHRYRGQFKTSGGEIGFFRENTRELVPVSHCLLMRPDINDSLSVIAGILKEMRTPDVPPFELHLSAGEGVTCFLKVPDKAELLSLFRDLARHLIDAGLAGVTIATAAGNRLTFGAERSLLRLNELVFAFSGAAFFQSNWDLNGDLIRTLLQELSPLTGKSVLDLYAGAGNFSLPLSREALRVIAVEENSQAVGDGRRNCRRNRIGNCRFVRTAAESLQVPEGIDVLILDPPRTGLTKRVMQLVLAMEPARIVYVSCNPSTLARDLKKLSVRYTVQSARMVDFFPQTYHVESVVHLTKDSP